MAPIALIDLWLMMFDDRQPLDLKAVTAPEYREKALKLVGTHG